MTIPVKCRHGIHDFGKDPKFVYVGEDNRVGEKLFQWECRHCQSRTGFLHIEEFEKLYGRKNIDRKDKTA